jgi:hypothetical protein
MMTTEYIACNWVKCRKVFYKWEYYYCFADTIKATINTKNVKEYIKSLLHNDLLKRHFHSYEVFLDVETTSWVQKMRCFNWEWLTNVFDYFSRRKKYESGLRKYKKVVMH